MLSKIRFLNSLIKAKKLGGRKLLVIESDDWGSERIPNPDVRERLAAKGVDVVSNPHSKYDTLERSEDIENLALVLKNFHLKYGKQVKLTTNFITSNPNFEKIQDSHFESYFFERFTESYRRRDNNNNVIVKLKELIQEGYVTPQYHGREHINVPFWLQELKAGSDSYKSAFELNCYAIDAKNAITHTKNLMAALEYQDEQQEDFIRNSLIEGHAIFEETFQRKSKTFIPARYVWNSALESTMEQIGVTHIQGSLIQQVPGLDKYNKGYHFTGEKSKVSSLKYLVRNAYFEPAYGGVDWVNACLKKVDLAFKFNTAAIISAHRINFVGGLNTKIRDSNLEQFSTLLETITRRYPEVEFLSSDELAQLV